IIVNQAVTNWPASSALWLVWQMPDATGKAQGLAIDNLAFAASDQPIQEVGPGLTVQAMGNDLIISWVTMPGQNYQVEYKNDLSETNWTPLGTTWFGNGSLLTLTNALSPTPERFYRLRLVP